MITLSSSSASHGGVQPRPRTGAGAMIARIEYPHLDADAYPSASMPSGMTAIRVAAAAVPGNAPPRRSGPPCPRHGAQQYLFEGHFVGRAHYHDPRNSLTKSWTAERDSDYAGAGVNRVARRAGLHVEGSTSPATSFSAVRRGAAWPIRRTSSSTPFTAARSSPSMPASSCCVATPATKPSSTPTCRGTPPRRRFSAACC